MIFCDCKKISYQNLKNKQRDSPELNKKFSLPKNLLFLRESIDAKTCKAKLQLLSF